MLTHLNGEAIVWQGDEYTDTAPIGALALLGALGRALQDFDPQPYHDGPGCQLERPAQSYQSATGEVELLLVFPSIADRVAGATALLKGPPYGDPGSSRDRSEPLDAKAAWLSRDNVMVLVRDYAGPTGQVVLQLLEELSATAAQ